MYLGLALTISVVFTCVNTRVHLNVLTFNLSMLTEENGTTIKNKDRK